jgi:ABC-type multidrug transport system ATPase subunit
VHQAIHRVRRTGPVWTHHLDPVDCVMSWHGLCDGVTCQQDGVRNCSLTVRSGEVVAVVGPFGSGKSSLIRALLGELKLLQGQVVGATPHESVLHTRQITRQTFMTGCCLQGTPRIKPLL